jgi:predicted short-subunit dehydrogenase-like oxidoreductase (DUF2520 family)
VPGRQLPTELGRAEIVFLAVPDPSVPAVAAAVAGRVPRSTAVVHLSGSLPLSSLAAATSAGHHAGSFHPFQSFPLERPPAAFAGSLIGVDATDELLAGRLFDLARELGGRPRRVPDEQRALYHVAAVLASNLMVGLVSTSSSVLESMGWSREDALAALLPLLAGVVGNVSSEGLEGALIGPIRRGDAETVSRHLDELDRRGLEEPARVYRILGIATLELALAAGLERERGKQIREALTGLPAATGGERDDDGSRPSEVQG